ncbi:asp-hemolysin [Aspergillus udagawae]|uniref:Asp-hemolysin n=1 Tax=Aspergillus udagawae TaxID=91492 RepID=A0A8H3N974_9EURO|nr:asp-hemolysin [Aspergillus udagawae]
MASATGQQFLEIEIKDDTKYDIRVENAHIDSLPESDLQFGLTSLSGEFYNEGDQNDTLTNDDVDDMVIRHNGGLRHICSCGEEKGFKGLQGTIDLVDDVKNAKICTLAWNAPMEAGKKNMFMMRDQDPRYNINIGKWNESGIMGKVPVTISSEE